MQRIFPLTVIIAAVFSTTLFSASPAFAYLDPGTGSMILQAIIGGIVGGMIAIKVYWKKVKGFFSGSKTESDDKTD